MQGAGGEVTWAATGISGAAPRCNDEIDQHLPTLPIWDIYSTEANKLSATWHRIIKQEFKLPLATHRYLLNRLSQCFQTISELPTENLK